MGGGGGSSGPTEQQLELQTQQATQTANLNLQENEQRKTILNAMQGMRVFRESAFRARSRATRPAPLRLLAARRPRKPTASSSRRGSRVYWT